MLLRYFLKIDTDYFEKELKSVFFIRDFFKSTHEILNIPRVVVFFTFN